MSEERRKTKDGRRKTKDELRLNSDNRQRATDNYQKEKQNDGPVHRGKNATPGEVKRGEHFAIAEVSARMLRINAGRLAKPLPGMARRPDGCVGHPATNAMQVREQSEIDNTTESSQRRRKI